jgi:hypothetical protein
MGSLEPFNQKNQPRFPEARSYKAQVYLRPAAIKILYRHDRRGCQTCGYSAAGSSARAPSVRWRARREAIMPGGFESRHGSALARRIHIFSIHTME